MELRHFGVLLHVEASGAVVSTVPSQQDDTGFDLGPFSLDALPTLLNGAPTKQNEQKKIDERFLHCSLNCQ